MQEVFNLTLSNVAQLLIYIFVGYSLRRKHSLPDQAGRVLSLLCVFVFSPGNSIYNLSRNVRMDVIGEKLTLFGFGVLIAGAVVLVGWLLAKPFHCNSVEKSSLTYAFTFPNYGYFGYVVIAGVFGSEMLADFMIFVLPTMILCSSYGFALFQKGTHFSLLRLLLMPTVIAVFIGIAIGLLGVQLPAPITDALSGASSCLGPCSMLLAGFMLGKFPLKKLFTGIRPYYLSAIRMIGIPALFGAVLMLCGVRGKLLFLPILLVCMPLGLNLVVYPESCGYEKEAGDNAKLCFVSCVLALIILPCIFALLTHFGT